MSAQYKLIHSIRTESSLIKICSLPNNKFAVGNINGSIDIYDSTTYTLIKTLSEHIDYITAFWLLKHDDTSLLVSCSKDKTIKIWDINLDDSLYTLTGLEDIVRYLVELPNGNIVTCSYDKSIQFWEKANHYKWYYTIENAHSSYINCILLLTDNRIISGGTDCVCKIWSEEPNKAEYQWDCIIHPNNKEIWSMAQLKNGRLCIGMSDGRIRIYEYPSLEIVTELRGHDSYVYSINEMYDGKIISESYNKTIKIWSDNDYSCLQTLHETERGWISVSEIGKGMIASLSNNRYLKIWKSVQVY